MAGIYIHIPFCKQACHYCDFHFSTSLKLKEPLIEALCSEIIQRKEYLKDQTIQTIYVGGGTPSLLTAEEIDRIFQVLESTFDLSRVKEITLEANPDDLTFDKLTELSHTPINRLSIGIQSFRHQDLTYLNRSHNVDQAIQSVQKAAELGFKSISVDLIYGIPQLTDSDWKSNIEQALRLPIDHLSCYALTIEEKTVFGNWHKKGRLTVMDEDEVNRQFLTLIEKASQHGFEQYEISNFSKKGSEAMHNSNYWKGKHYVGIGPGAHSYDGKSRQWNIAHNVQYIKGVTTGEPYFEIEELSPSDQFNEYILTSLRTRWGCDLHMMKEKWGIDLSKNEAITLLLEQQLIHLSDQFLKLTEKGKLLADSVTEKLFI